MINPIFNQYRDKHSADKAILFGTGPSLRDFKCTNLNDYVLIGTNEILHQDFKMDYYFIGDAGTPARGYKREPELYNDYIPNIQKFIRKPLAHWVSHLPPDISNAEYYSTTHFNFRTPPGNYKNADFSSDITLGVTDGGSISFEALQFALFAGFKEIYLVGHDCNYSKGSFHDPTAKDLSKHVLVNSWNSIPNFLKNNYPDVEIFSVNPVSLQLFKEKQI